MCSSFSQQPFECTVYCINNQYHKQYNTKRDGTFTQQGQVGTFEGKYGCTTGGNGSIKFTGLRSEKGGIVGNYTGRDDFSCSFRGNVGGMRTLTP